MFKQVIALIPRAPGSLLGGDPGVRGLVTRVRKRPKPARDVFGTCYRHKESALDALVPRLAPTSFITNPHALLPTDTIQHVA